MSGIKVVDDLNSKIKQGQDILDLKLLELDTLVCQNDCSGHGKCQESTRECICEPFWIENSVRRHLMDGKKNCGKRLKCYQTLSYHPTNNDMKIFFNPL